MIFRWRTRDIEGNLFRQAKSNSKPEAGPPRDSVGTERYKQHLPFQVFCCESGTHVVDPEQSYYRNIAYRASPLSHNLSTTQEQPSWDPETPCMDSTQMWFCRDLWTDTASRGLKQRSGHKNGGAHKRDLGVSGAWSKVKRLVTREPEPAPEHASAPAQAPQLAPQDGTTVPPAEPAEPVAEGVDEKHVLHKRQQPPKAPPRPLEDDRNGGTDQDAIDEDAAPAPEPLKPQDFLIPNSAFASARILVNPRCVTTYGDKSHQQLAIDLFGTPESQQDVPTANYALDDWAGAPDSFVCQEMRTTGGRTAPKSQRRVGFLLQNEVRSNL